MSGEINFGLLDTNMPAKVGNAFYQGQQEAAQFQSLQNQNKLTDISIQDHQRALNDQTAMTNAIRGNVDPATGQVDHQGVMKTLAQNGSGHLVQQYYNNVLANQKTAADVSKTNADTSASAFDLKTKKYNQAIHDISSFNNPQEAIDSVKAHVASGEVDPLHAQAVIQSIPPDPAKFKDWQLSMIKTTMDAKERMNYEAPDANTAAKNNTSIKTTGMNNATSVKTTGMNIGKDYKVAGLDSNGNFPTTEDGAATGSVKNLGDSIGNYAAPESTILARVSPALKGQVMTYVSKTYPDYSPSLYGERQATMHSFAPNGNNGKTVQALNVAVDHLATFGDLATALNNGDNQTLNSIGNKIATWTGSSAPTNFEAAKNIVMDEVTKGVIGAAGGQGDREKMAAIVSAANSPQQLAGAIKTVTSLMGGRLQGVEQSYRAGSGGRIDFADKYLTPNSRAAFGQHGGAPAATPANGAPMQISSDADYAKLPSGAEFIAPDGSHRKKP